MKKKQEREMKTQTASKELF